MALQRKMLFSQEEQKNFLNPPRQVVSCMYNKIITEVAQGINREWSNLKEPDLEKSCQNCEKASFFVDKEDRDDPKRDGESEK